MSDFPVPEGGFGSSIFANIYYLMSQCKNESLHKEIKKLFPWVLWFIWKKRNNLLFEKDNFDALQTMGKIREEVELWFLAQKVEEECGITKLESQVKIRKKWRPPPKPWLKCNVGSVWAKDKQLGGMAWVLRDEVGNVLMHSRRSVAFIKSNSECSFVCLAWAAESLLNHRVKRVVFASEDPILVGVLSRPIAWPSFRLQSSDLYHILTNFRSWRLELEGRCTNRGAFLIARSAIKEELWQSYVASGPPRWLSLMFDDERSFPSV